MDEAEVRPCWTLIGRYLQPRVTIACFLALMVLGTTFTYVCILGTLKILFILPYKAMLNPTIKDLEELLPVPTLLCHLIFWIIAGYLSLRYLIAGISFKLLDFIDWLMQDAPPQNMILRYDVDELQYHVGELQYNVRELWNEVDRLRDLERIILRFTAGENDGARPPPPDSDSSDSSSDSLSDSSSDFTLSSDSDSGTLVGSEVDEMEEEHSKLSLQIKRLGEKHTMVVLL